MKKAQTLIACQSYQYQRDWKWFRELMNQNFKIYLRAQITQIQTHPRKRSCLRAMWGISQWRCVWTEPLFSSPEAFCLISSANIHPFWFSICVHWLAAGHIRLIHPQVMSRMKTHKPLAEHSTLAAKTAETRGRWAALASSCKPYFPLLVFSPIRSALVYSPLFWKQFWVQYEWMYQRVPSILSRT